MPEKIENIRTNLKSNTDNFELVEEVSAHPDKIRLQIEENKSRLFELDKRREALLDIKQQFVSKLNEPCLTGSVSSNETSTFQLEIFEKKIDDLEVLWSELKVAVDNRDKLLTETLQCSQVFWNEHDYMNEIMTDLNDRIKLLESETVALDPDSVLEQQQYHQQIIKDIDENENKFNEMNKCGEELLKLCSKSDQVDVQKALDEAETQWTKIKETCKDHEVDLQTTFTQACEFQQELIEILEWISLQQEKFVNLDSNLNSDDPKTIRFQINLLKEFKEKVDPEQMKILILNQKFNNLKSNTRTNQSF